MIIIYSTMNCPKCSLLKTFLTSRRIPFVARDVSEIDASMRTDMIIEKDYFPLSVPILQTSRGWLYVNEMFKNDWLNEDIVEIACKT